MIDETLEEWVERVKQEPIWREVCFLIDKNFRNKGGTPYKKCLLKELTNTFSSDVFSGHWLEAPKEINLSISNDVIRHSTMLILHARQEVTRKVPGKECLWRALRAMYEEAEWQKQVSLIAQSRITELEEELLEARELGEKE